MAKGFLLDLLELDPSLEAKDLVTTVPSRTT